MQIYLYQPEQDVELYKKDKYRKKLHVTVPASAPEHRAFVM
jgi:hypothetical protein